MTDWHWGLFVGLSVFVIVAEIYSRVMIGIFNIDCMVVAKSQTFVAMVSAMIAGFYVWSSL